MGAVSYSGLMMFEKCPRSFKYKYIDKLQVSGTFTPSPAMLRGSKLHNAAEYYVDGSIDVLPEELRERQKMFDRLRGFDYALPEWEFNLTEDWTGIPFERKEDGFIRGIIDLLVPHENLLEIKEYKTGRVYDSHPDQRGLYGMAGLVLFPQVDHARITTVYFDLGGADQTTEMSRSDLEAIKWSWARRINKTVDVGQPYPMRPSKMNCKWCDYSKKKGGPCPN